jgi:CheY-like chemotaxis protein
LKNAVEASPPGATVSVSAQAGSEGTVAIRIHNQGAVPAAVRATFFQKYASMGKASGTGLGTYSARLMARVQDGDVAMATDDVEGTTLTVVLRAAPPDAVPATARHLAERRGIDPAVLSALPPTRVLLVDDDEYNLLIVRRFLPAPPFTVETAINGRVALAAAQANWPGLVFMDLDMPVMGGMEAVSELRALQRSGGHPPCAIVALSSHDDEATRRQAIAAGFDRYLTKPVTREVIHETLLALCETGAAPPSAASLAGRDDPVVIDEELRPIVARFIQSRLALLDEMDAALGTGAHDEMRRIAHKLAGSFALYGFAWAGERARWIEHHGAANAGAVPEAIAELRGHLQQARAHHPAGSTA